MGLSCLSIPSLPNLSSKPSLGDFIPSIVPAERHASPHPLLSNTATPRYFPQEEGGIPPSRRQGQAVRTWGCSAALPTPSLGFAILHAAHIDYALPCEDLAVGEGREDGDTPTSSHDVGKGRGRLLCLHEASTTSKHLTGHLRGVYGALCLPCMHAWSGSSVFRHMLLRALKLRREKRGEWGRRTFHLPATYTKTF